jgi:DNA-directed RNA polymerase subunit RPC12/RpoP
MNTYICVHCGAAKLSPTLPKGWKDFYYLDTTDNCGSTWHLGYNCAECVEKRKESDNEDN